MPKEAAHDPTKDHGVTCDQGLWQERAPQRASHTKSPLSLPSRNLSPGGTRCGLEARQGWDQRISWQSLHR